MFDVLIEATLRATLIAAAALAALSLLRVQAAAVRHRVWTVVLLAMLLLPFWSAWAPEVVLRVLPAAQPSTSASSAIAPPFLPGAPAGDAMAPTPPAAERAAAGTTEQTPHSRAAERWNWRVWVLALYTAGAAALLARLAIGTWRVRALARDARVVSGRLTCARIATPFTVGWLDPKILLPEGWDRWPAARLAAVLEHEGAHVRRRDPLVLWLALLNRALFWFHPLAWWLERRLAALAEEACDAAVLARGHAPDAYSEHLLHLARMARRRQTPAVVGVPMPGSALPARIAKILDGRVARPGSRLAAAGAAALAALGAVALGAITLAQEVASPPLIPGPDSFTPLPEHWHGDDEWHLEVALLMTPEEEQAPSASRPHTAWPAGRRSRSSSRRRAPPSKGTRISVRIRRSRSRSASIRSGSSRSRFPSNTGTCSACGQRSSAKTAHRSARSSASSFGSRRVGHRRSGVPSRSSGRAV